MPATAALPPAPSSLARLWAATRPYSFPAAVVPAALGTAAAARIHRGDLVLDWLGFLLVVLGCVAIQAVSNLVNDLYDSRTGLDNPGNFGRFNALVAGRVSEAEVRGLIAACATISLAIGVYFVVTVGAPMLVLVAAGAVLAFGYTAPPLRLKYRALGDLAVLLGFGLGMVFGAYLAQAAGQSDAFAPRSLAMLLAAALPSALIVVAILHANNHRDRANDREYGAATLSNVLPARASKALLLTLLIGPYALVAAGVLARLLPYPTLLAAVSLPAALGVLRRVRNDDYEGPLVPEIAKLHGLFGLLTTLGLTLG